MILTITLIELRSPLLFFKLSAYHIKITKQAKNASCISIKSTGFWTSFYTMTLWESTEAMKNFARSGLHLEAMKLSSTIAREVRTLSIESNSLLSWNEAKEKLRSSGKILKY